MKYIAMILAFFAVAQFVLPDEAEAARFGGGRSFGSSPSISKPSVPSGGAIGGTSTLNRQGTGAAGAATGMMGAGMGLFGGLLAGSLIGSMLMGTPMGGGGFFDILIIGVLIFVVYKLFTRRRNSLQTQQYSQRQSQQSGMWDNLKEQPAYSQQNTTTTVKADFDTQEFIEGAKLAYVRMQESWDKRDLNDIAQFTTTQVFNEIKKQNDEDNSPSETEILTLNAEIGNILKENSSTLVSVYFNALLREEKSQQAAKNVTEVWHFKRESDNDPWKIDGITQV